LEGFERSPPLGIGNTDGTGNVPDSVDILNTRVSTGVILSAVPLSVFTEIPH